ncbi:MAG TPA: cation diffusion facilitator family transporter [Longimicrobiales bacterium]
MERTARGIRTVILGLAVNAGLVLVKITTGILGNSYALVADGVESSLDVFSSLVVWRGLFVAGRSADERYHFGYGKAEAVAAAVVSIMLLVAAVGISLQAVREILTPHHAPAPYTLVVLVLVIAVKEGLFRTVLRVGSDIGSPAVEADAWHHRSDAVTSAAAFVGILTALVGGPGWEAADDWAALVASGIIAWNGARLLRPSIQDLMDRAPDPDVLERVRQSAEAVAGVAQVEKILARRAGIGYFAALHVQCDPELSLRSAHEMGHRVKDAVIAAVPEVRDAIVHMEPYEGGTAANLGCVEAPPPIRATGPQLRGALDPRSTPRR